MTSCNLYRMIQGIPMHIYLTYCGQFSSGGDVTDGVEEVLDDVLYLMRILRRDIVVVMSPPRTATSISSLAS